jgi:hypothetical protein
MQRQQMPIRLASFMLTIVCLNTGFSELLFCAKDCSAVRAEPHLALKPVA